MLFGAVCNPETHLPPDCRFGRAVGFSEMLCNESEFSDENTNCLYTMYGIVCTCLSVLFYADKPDCAVSLCIFLFVKTV